MSILGTTGRAFVELGGAQSWRTFTTGDIVASLQWIDLRSHGSQEDGPEPVLALYPAHRRMQTAAYIIPQARAHEFADRRGNPTAQLLGSAFKAAIAMGFHPDKSTVHRIVDVIVDAMPELIRMPATLPSDVQARAKRPVYGIEARAQVNGRTVVETVL